MKKLLLIGWNYETYTQEIINELDRSGYSVVFYNMISYSVSDKLTQKFCPGRYDKARKKSEDRIVRNEKSNKYDIIFVLLPVISFPCLSRLRKDHPDSSFILYMWDTWKIATSYCHVSDIEAYMQCFDRTYTFDKQDAELYKMNYLPLFCINKFLELRSNGSSGPTIYSVGNLANIRRYEAIKLFESYCKHNHLSFEWYLKSTLRKNITLLTSAKSIKNLHLSSINYSRFDEMIRNSTAVFDFANHIQSGYTMRVIENLCAGKKIITNNYNILSEPFYSRDRIFVYHGLNFEGVKEFMSIPLEEPNKQFECFHLSSFLKQILTCN